MRRFLIRRIPDVILGTAIAALIIFFFWSSIAITQTPTFYVLRDSSGTTFNVKGFACGSYLCFSSIPVDYNGNPMVGPAGTPSAYAMTIQGLLGGTQVPISVGSLPPAARHFPGCTVGTGSATCLAAATAVTFVQIQNTSTTASIACNWGGTAVLNSAGSFQLAPLAAAAWGPSTGGVPSGELNCIASAASTPAFLEWN
jgi:hypothetical protein